jgi:hypothetical protein
LKRSFDAFYIYIILIVATGVIAYSNTFEVPFTFDDIPGIVENERIKDFGNFWPPSGSRYVGQLTFALNYQMGGLDVTGYHVFNLVIHILNALFVFWVVMLTFRTPFFAGGSGSTERYGNAVHVAFISGLLFVVHPLQTQAVTYVVQRFASLATFFYLFSLIMYIKAEKFWESSIIFFRLFLRCWR